LRRAALEQVGAFDERFFMYFEEVDLCLRLHDAGWKVCSCPTPRSCTTADRAHGKCCRKATLYRYRSLGAFYRKHYPAWHWGVLKVAIGAAVMMRLIATRFNRPNAPLSAGCCATFGQFKRGLPWRRR